MADLKYNNADELQADIDKGVAAKDLVDEIIPKISPLGGVCASGSTVEAAKFKLKTIVSLDIDKGISYTIKVRMTPSLTQVVFGGLRDSSNVAFKTFQTKANVTEHTLIYDADKSYTNANIYLSIYDALPSSTKFEVEVSHNGILAKKSDVISLDERVTILEEKSIITDNSYASNALKKLHQRLFNENGVENKGTTFLHFTDLHADTTNLSRIKTFYNYYNELIDDVITSGDIVRQKVTDDFSFFDMDNALLCIGNHEIWKSIDTKEADPATESACFSAFFSSRIENWNVTHNGNNHCYYYKDYDSGLRLVVVDIYHWNSTQKTWLEGVLADARTNNKTIIGVSHQTLGSGNNFQVMKSAFSTRQYVSLRSQETYIETARVECESCITSHISAGGLFSVWLCGHTHNDYIGLTANGLPTIVLEQATSSRSMSDCRFVGEKSQDSFNLMTVDVTNKKVYICRIGNDLDVMMMRKRYLCFDYDKKEIVGES